MIEVDGNDPRVTELDRQVAQWHRPASLASWNQELADLGQVPGNVHEQAGWVMMFAGATVSWSLFAVLAWATGAWWLALPMTLVAGWALRKAWRDYALALAWKKDSQRVRLVLLQEYPTNGREFRWESQDHPALQVAYRRLRQTDVPILAGDVEYLRRHHGLEDPADLAMGILLFGGFTAMGAILMVFAFLLAPLFR